MKEDMGAYEIDLPSEFDILDFEDRVESGDGELWMVMVAHDDMYRFRGVITSREWARLAIDVGDGFMYVTSPSNQDVSKHEIAKEVKRIVGGLRMYKDGVEV
jgi:hypothetical protein